MTEKVQVGAATMTKPELGVGGPKTTKVTQTIEGLRARKRQLLERQEKIAKRLSDMSQTLTQIEATLASLAEISVDGGDE